MPYEELLDEVLAAVPRKAITKDRWEVPGAQVMPAGLRTEIINFHQIADYLRRDPSHLLKFLLKELATKGEFKDSHLVVIGKFTAEHVTRKIELYVKQFVICPECKKPDTRLTKEKDFWFLICEACGARHSLGK